MNERPSRCVLHFGMHKTGSTSIQESLVGLSDENFYYPRLGRASHHNIHLTALFSSKAGQLLDARRNVGKIGEDGDYAGDVRKAVADARGRTLILSSEGLFSSLAPSDIVRLKMFLDQNFDSYQFAGYARPLQGLVSSRLQQRIKSGTRTTLDLKSLLPRYRRRIEPFDNVFGRDRIAVWKFDRAAFPQGDVVADFCQRIGVTLPPSSSRQRSNESVSRELAALLFSYNIFCARHGIGAVRQRNGKLNAVRALNGFKGTPLRLAATRITKLAKRSRDDVAWIEQRTGQTFKEVIGQDDAGAIGTDADLQILDPVLIDLLRQAIVGLGKQPPEPSDADFAAQMVHMMGESPTLETPETEVPELQA